MSTSVQTTHFGVVLGPPAGQPYNARTTAEFMTDIHPADLGPYCNLLTQSLEREHVHESGAIRYGEHSPYYTTNPVRGAFVKFLGGGWGELFVQQGGTTHFAGDIRDGSWAYIPQGLYFYYLCRDGIIGDLWMHSVGANTTTLYRP